MVTEKAAPGCLFCGSLLHCVFENCALHVSVREYVTPSGQWENGAEERVPGTVMQSALCSEAFMCIYMLRDFSADPVARTPSSQCSGPRFNPW